MRGGGSFAKDAIGNRDGGGTEFLHSDQDPSPIVATSSSHYPFYYQNQLVYAPLPFSGSPFAFHGATTFSFPPESTSFPGDARDKGSSYLPSQSNSDIRAYPIQRENEEGPVEMEGSGQIAIATPAPSILHAHNQNHDHMHMTMPVPAEPLARMGLPAADEHKPSSAGNQTSFAPAAATATTTPSKPQAENRVNETQQWLPGLDTPVNTTSHGIESNMRDTAHHAASQDAMKQPPIVTPQTMRQTPSSPLQRPVEPSTPSNAAAPSTSNFAADEDEQPTQAYAKLEFADSYALITTTHLMIVRDMNHQASWERQRKERKKRLKARRDMEAYAREPSHHSQYDDEELRGHSDDDLVGHIKPSLLSNFSETGGPVAFVDPDEEAEELSSRGKRRKNNSSSNHSIAPLSLHDLDRSQLATEAYAGENQYANTDPSQWAQLPIHTPRPEDIKKISREHLLFRYSSEKAKWVMDVVGNQIVVASANGQQENVYKRSTTDIVLNHDDEIFISSVRFRFILPAELVDESSEEEVESDDVLESVETFEDATAATSPAARRISDMIDSIESGEEDDADDKQKSRPKIKLKIGKPGGKSGGKQPSEPKASEKMKAKAKGKGKEPATSGKKPASSDKTVSKTEGEPEESSAAPKQEPSQSAEPRPSQALPAGPPPALDPTSAYAAVDPSQYPEKRKGPGRPPKNGLLSKRDDAGVKRKRKDYERQGVEPPPLNELLAMVRQEQKQKDAAAKAQQRGEPVPDTVTSNHELPGPHVPQSMGPAQSTAQAQPQVQGSGSPSEIPAQRPMSPRPPRRAKSPSPMPPENHYTEEQLKKPNMTYIYLLDEILQNIDGGQADLQTIYDRIQKRWPYYKYKVGSMGWQSSVRHNLLSCERFVESGKSGKGKFWRINTAHELDAKKKRPSPPPRPPMPMQNGQMQYSQNPYGPPSYNGGYGHNHNAGAHAHGSNAYPGSYNHAGASGSMPPPQSTQGHHGAYPRPPQPNGPVAPPVLPQRTPFEILVAEIVEFQNRYLAQFSAAEKQSRAEFLNAAVTGVETYVKAQNETTNTIEAPDMDFKQEPFKTLKSIFERHTNAVNPPQNQGAATTNADNSANPVQAPATTTANGPANPPAVQGTATVNGNGSAHPVQAAPPSGPPAMASTTQPASNVQGNMPVPGSGGSSAVQQQQPMPPQAPSSQQQPPPQAAEAQQVVGQQYQTPAPPQSAPSQVQRTELVGTSQPVNGLPRPTSSGIKRSADDEAENDAKRVKTMSEEPEASLPPTPAE